MSTENDTNDAFGAMIAAALREKTAQRRLPSDFTDRLVAAVRSFGAPASRTRFPVRKAAAIWLALGLGALAAVVGRVILNVPGDEDEAPEAESEEAVADDSTTRKQERTT